MNIKTLILDIKKPNRSFYPFLVVLLSEIDDQTLVEGLRKSKHLTETEPTKSGWTIQQIGELSLVLGGELNKNHSQSGNKSGVEILIDSDQEKF